MACTIAPEYRLLDKAASSRAAGHSYDVETGRGTDLARYGGISHALGAVHARRYICMRLYSWAKHADERTHDGSEKKFMLLARKRGLEIPYGPGKFSLKGTVNQIMWSGPGQNQVDIRVSFSRRTNYLRVNYPEFSGYQQHRGGTQRSDVSLSKGEAERA